MLPFPGSELVIWVSLKEAIGWWQPALNGFRMGTRKWLYDLRIDFGRVHELAGCTPEPGIILPLGLPLRTRFQPSVVIDCSARVGCPWVTPFLMRVQHHKE